LRGIADALEAVQLEPFLEQSAALTHALADAPGKAPEHMGDRAAVLAEIAAARVQLERGRRLGAALTALIGVAATSDRWPGGYGRDGQPALPAAATAVNERG